MRAKKTWKPLGFSKTVASEFLSAEPLPEPSRRPRNGNRGGRPRVLKRVDVEEPHEGLAPVVALRPAVITPPMGARPIKSPSMAALVREWLAELKVMNRSPQTIEWYQQKMEWYLQHEGGPATLDGLTSAEVKRLLGALMDRGLAPNTVHGFFQVIRAMVNWAIREGYPADPAIVKMRPPKAPIAELETFTAAQQDAMVNAANPGWARLAVQILLGTGMRCGELAALTVSDFEDDGEVGFLKVRHGKGAKFRRVPLSSRLRREVERYINRHRVDSETDELLLRSDGEPVRMMTVEYLLRRIKDTVGFKCHAHKFRHTFATDYLRNGGDIERLRRILGHSSYVMVMRYLHLDKGDLGKDFDLRSPF